MYPSATVPFVLVNNYGPTECTVVSTSGVVAANAANQSFMSQAPSIGRAIDGVEIYILDEQQQPVTDGFGRNLYRRRWAGTWIQKPA